MDFGIKLPEKLMLLMPLQIMVQFPNAYLLDGISEKLGINLATAIANGWSQALRM